MSTAGSLIASVSHRPQYTMTFFYESEEDLALRGQGCLSGNADTFAAMENISSMDMMDFIDAHFSDSSESPEEDERREDRYEQMASRHHM